ncbi:omega amino acid--pyruvate aminotransferase [Mesorhizobium sp. SEMIA 3007]|jgi:beta-alanine--pyruvate transaminase|uniref:aspartate aminotransferase family protein n=1 Tax=Mesorhizobium TaxID=68287 RepID=UPI000366D35D|nr:MULTISPECIES: aspartate aminotransferase family protein [Mesorhizobium]AID31044.1 aminotransferase class III-fold pyridoxal phosphate-dependent enzyme [Mesorhizobium huakuii 7653R]ANN61543.1 omega amino acid--pyruvate aminotransferase [Mesorhizobium loti NZP2037]MCH4557923.1 aspartate aminotransferase family protein [Mesorhizobium jarvisii]ODA95924.1 omega amino acid--pyruvate aminotransferase [Mesorhizobium sp. SEMIA 3007]BCH09123.1 aspartate aminotransferase family protein [Mesorhizobium 
MSNRLKVTPNDLSAFWMPFTANRQFKQAPRMFVSAKDMHYTTSDGRKVLDGTAGLWCVNAGHCRPKITEAIQHQAAELDYAPAFQMGHPIVFELANRLVDIAPKGMDHVFFTNSGSESVETALKMAIAYHRMKGEGARTRLIGRERGYHGVNFGGISVGGIVSNRKMFGTLLGGVDHMPHTHLPEKNAFSKGVPEYGAELANELERIVALHDASTIAAVIVEPVAGSTGVILPPKGYLQKLREICTKHGILLIFDEVITGFGRLGAPFAADYFGVTPDIMTTAKGVSNGVIPMGAVFVKKEIHDAFMTGPEHMIEFFHGYTYSGNPIACAAALGTLDTYKEEGLLTRGEELAPYWEDALHSLKGEPHVIDIRNIGLIGAIELAPIAGSPTKRAFSAFVKAFERGALIRTTGDIIALSPPLIITKGQINELIDHVREVLRSID